MVGIKKIKYHYVFIFEIRSQRRIVTIGRFPLTLSRRQRHQEMVTLEW